MCRDSHTQIVPLQMVIMFEATRTMSMHLPVLLASIVANAIAALCKQDGACVLITAHAQPRPM